MSGSLLRHVKRFRHHVAGGVFPSLASPVEAASSFRYWAFISYAHADAKAATRMHRSLETYRMPRELVGSATANVGRPLPTRLQPIFLDRDELGAAASLGEQLEAALRESLNLIVVCSPNAVRSRWVEQEVRYFKSLGREGRVFCLIVDGEPGDSDRECFGPALRHRVDGQGRLTDEPTEPIAADARPGRSGSRDAMLKLVAGMAGVGFDSLRQRDQRRRQRRLVQGVAALSALVVVLAALAFYAFSQRNAALTELQASTARRLVSEGAAKVAGAALDEEVGWQGLLAAVVLAPDAGADVALNDLLRRSPRTPQVIAAGHATQIALSPRGDRLVTGGEDGRLQLWDATTGLAISSAWPAHADPVTRIEFSADHTRTSPEITRIAFSPDGRLIATASADTSVRVWDAVTGAAIGEPLRVHRWWVNGLVFLPGGDRLASVGDSLAMLDVATGRLLGEVATDPVRTLACVAISPDGRWLVACSPDGLRLWGAADARPVSGAWQRYVARTFAAAFSPDGTRIVSGGEGGTLVQWDVATGGTLGTPWHGHQGPVRSVAYSPDGTRVVSGGDDATVRVWDAASGAAIGSPWVGHKGRVTTIAFSPRGDRVYSGGTDGTVRIWPVRDVATPFGPGNQNVDRLAFSPDGTRIALGGANRVVQLRDAASGATLAPALHPDEDAPIAHLGFDLSGGGLYILTNQGISFTDARITAWTRPAALNALANDMRPVALSSDGRLLASWDAGRGVLQVWDTATGQPLRAPWPAAELSMVGVIFSADGTRVLSYGNDGRARIWDSRTGKALGEPMQGHEERVIDAAFSATGERIVTAGADATIRLWDGRTGQALAAPWRGHDGPVARVVFTPDGARVLSGGRDGSLRLWDVATGLQLGEAWQDRADGRSGLSVSDIAIRPDGRSAVSAHLSGDLRLWRMPEAAAATACRVLTRNMSVKRWSDWVSPRIEYRCQCGALPVAPDDPDTPTPPERCEARHTTRASP